MKIYESADGKSWVGRGQGRERGLIVLARVGRHRRHFYMDFSAPADGCRRSLATFPP